MSFEHIYLVPPVQSSGHVYFDASVKSIFSHFSQTVLHTLDNSLMFYHFGMLFLDSVYPYIHDISCSNSILSKNFWPLVRVIILKKMSYFQFNFQYAGKVFI